MIDFKNLTIEEALELGFCKWRGNLYLIPAGLYNDVPNGLEVTCIMGQTEIWDGTQDNDTRGGLLAYGVKLDK